MLTLISKGPLRRALFLCLTLPLTAVAQTPVKEPMVVTLSPNQGFCDPKFVPLTEASVRVAFAEVAARQGVTKFLGTVGMGKLSARVVGLLESGKMRSITIDPKTIFAAYSVGRDGAMFGPLVTLASDREIAALEERVDGAPVYLLLDSCSIAIPYPTVDPAARRAFNAADADRALRQAQKGATPKRTADPKRVAFDAKEAEKALQDDAQKRAKGADQGGRVAFDAKEAEKALKEGGEKQVKTAATPGPDKK